MKTSWLTQENRRTNWEIPLLISCRGLDEKIVIGLKKYKQALL